jgi:serine/threonine-protein kinase RsbW
VTGTYPVLRVGSPIAQKSQKTPKSQIPPIRRRPRKPRGSGMPGGRWARAFRGTTAAVPEARQFAGELLAGCPAREVLLMCVSELCANAIIHSASGNGGVFIVEVGCPRDGVARVAVTDEGGPLVPAVGALDPAAEGGRGLALVAACTSRWGYADAYPGRTVWAEASWPVAVPGPPPGPRTDPPPGPPPDRPRDRPPDPPRGLAA